MNSRRRVAGVGVMVILFGLYLAFPTHRWEEGVGLLPLRSGTWLPGTVYRPGTLASFALWGLAVGAGWGASRLHIRQGRMVMIVLVLAGGVMATVVLGQRLAPVPFPVYDQTGWFANENHFAAFANLIFPWSLGLAARATGNSVLHGRRSSPAGLYVILAGLLAAAVIVSGSRAGAVILAASFGAWVLWAMRFARAHPFWIAPSILPLRPLGFVAASGVVIAAGWVVLREWSGWTVAWNEIVFRGTILRDAWNMGMDRPWWGIGPGTFAVAFPYYQSDALYGVMVRHAHCEPLQLVVEWGVMGTLGMAFALFLMIGALPRHGSSDIPPFADVERVALAIGLAGFALHALIDFPFRQPVLALGFVVGLTLYICSRKRESAT